MTRSTDVLRDKLTQAGITLNAPTKIVPPQAPWFVRVLQAFSGWLAALFLLGFIATGVVIVLESPVASMGAGLAMVGAAFVLLRMARGDVLEHLALAVSLAGQLLIAWGIVEQWALSTSLWWLLFGLQAMLALVMPSQVHRTFSTFAASIALYMALAMSDMAPVASGLVMLTLTLLWMNEFRWTIHVKALQACGYGLLIGLLVMQGLAHSGQSFTFWFDSHSTNAFAGFAPWLSAAFDALSLMILLYTFFQTKAHWSLYLSPIALLLVSFYMPGVGQGVVVLLLGFAIGHRWLMGLGALSLLIGIGSYYYWLDVTLFTKSITLLVMGGLLLILRCGLRWGCADGRMLWLLKQAAGAQTMKGNARRSRVVSVATMLFMLAGVNWAIWTKERHMAEGDIVYVELAPVDPRSLIQGDYMALNFALANQLQAALSQQEDSLNASNGYVIVRLDENRVADFQRLDNGIPVRDEERRLFYRVRNGQVRFATDAFFFQEGHADRYELARYGQLRVNANGEPLLVAMYDAELNKLGEMVR